jgi:hypothetical protein
MKKNKKGMEIKPSSFLIGLLVVPIVSLGLFFFLGDLSQTYGTPVNTSFNSTYSNVNELVSLANQTSAGVEQANNNGGVVDVFGSLSFGSTAILNTIKMVFVGFKSIGSMFNDLGRFLGLPGWLVGLVISIIVLMIVFAVIRILLRIPGEL